MSRLDNIDSLEQQLADLQMINETNPNIRQLKKIPPTVPPKKKAQPQVPQSATVNKLREPSFSTRITSVADKIYPPTYANVHHQNNNMPTSQKDYAYMNHMSTQNRPINQNLPMPSNAQVTYSNLAMPQQKNLAPPPPPPPTYISSMKSVDDPQNIQEYLPPPSPVSSNYSELVRATSHINNYNHEQTNYNNHIYQNDFPEYGVSQTSGTYESLYEPINPLPASNLSVNSYPDYQQKLKSSSKSPLPKEEEVDALTNLLVKSISSSQDVDVFGICVKCNEKVKGESSGCTAMGNMYHVQCFCCQMCNVNLQGKPFYAVEGHPHCETDYYKTLEKCSVCGQPILDRILRATGKPYHPTCFTCVVCDKSLDGIPFTVDAMNQIHCIEDFHKKFAPRCCVCKMPIMPEEGEEETVRVVALDRSFHVRCYQCEDCGMILSSESEGRGCYPLDGHILCMDCNAQRIRQLTNVMTTDL